MRRDTCDNTQLGLAHRLSGRADANLSSCVSMISRGESRLMFDLQFSDLQHYHVFVNRLQDRISETGAPVQKTPLRDIKDEELHQWAQRKAIEEFLLMKPTFVEVT